MKIIKAALRNITAVVLLLSAASAQSAAIDSYVRAEMTRLHIPGLALVVVKDQKIVKESYYGLANVELNVPVNDHTSFEIASMSKQFTDAAILLLAEEGKIGLDDNVRKYLDDLPAEWHDITIRQLMLHTAGLRDDWDEPDDFFLTKNTDEEFLRALTAFPLKFKPGERFSYGCGPFVLGMVIKKITGKPYSQFMRERIFTPLGMTETQVNDPQNIVPNRASGYMFENGVLKNGVRISPAAEARGDVGIRTTARDLAKWDAALNDTRLLQQSSLDVMFSPGKLNDGVTIPVGFGWFLYPVQGDVWKHGGAFRTGFSSTIDRHLDDRLTVIVLTNLRSGSIAPKIGQEVAAFYNSDYRPRAKLVAERDTDPQRTERLKSFLLSLAAGNNESKQTTPGFPFKLYRQNDWEELGVGKMKSFTFLTCRDFSARPKGFFNILPKQICTYKISGESDEYVSFALTDDGKVIYVEPFE